MEAARPIIDGGAVVIAVAGLLFAVSRLQPAAPVVERASVWIDTVKRGPFVREVRGTGTLVPEDLRWIPAVAEGRVERIRLFPVTARSSWSGWRRSSMWAGRRWARRGRRFSSFGSTRRGTRGAWR